jgi:MFS family permease
MIARPPQRLRRPGRWPRRPELLRQQAFRRYWSAQTISVFGDQISSVAVPYTAILTLHADAAEMGYLTAAIWLPSLLFGLHAGAWADRRGHRRRLMITADLGRAALLATVPTSAALHVLTLGQLYAVAFGVGSLSVLFTVSDPALFVALVPEDQYLPGQSLVYGSRAFSFVGGPSVGGLLVQLLTAPFAVAADAASYLGSAFFLSRIDPAEPPPEPAGRGGLTAGARYVARNGLVRASLIAAAIINLFTFMVQTLFVLYATRSLHVRPGELGLVLGAGAVGRCSARWRPGGSPAGWASAGPTSSARCCFRPRCCSSRWPGARTAWCWGRCSPRSSWPAWG